MATTRKNYSKLLKESAIRFVVEKGIEISEVARELNINASTLGRWIREEQRKQPQSVDDVRDELTKLEEIQTDFGIKSKSMRRDMDNVISSIKDCILDETSSSKDSPEGKKFEDSNGELKKSHDNVSTTYNYLENKYNKLAESCKNLRSNSRLTDKAQSTDESILTRISSYFSRLKQEIKKQDYWSTLRERRKKRADDNKLDKYKQEIDTHKNRLLENADRITAAEILVKCKFEDIPRFDQILEKSSKYFNWGIIPILVPYTSIYFSKLLMLKMNMDATFWGVVALEILVLVVGWIFYIKNYEPNNIIWRPILLLLSVPVVHIGYLSYEVGYSFRTDGMTTLTIFDTSFFVFFLSIFVLYCLRRRLLTGFNVNELIKSMKKSTKKKFEVLNEFINAKFQHFQWLFLFFSVGLLIAVSASASFVVSMNDEQVKYREKSYAPVLSSNDRVILVGPISSGNNESNMNVISVPSSELSCSGNEGACPGDKPGHSWLSINQATVGELRLLSARIDDSVKDTDLGYKKLVDCLNKTKTTEQNKTSFRIDFFFCKNKHDVYEVALFTRNGMFDKYVPKDTEDLKKYIKPFLKQVKKDGELHYIGAASDPGEVNSNLSLGQNRLNTAKKFIDGIIAPLQAPENPNYHMWPFGPFPLIELDLLISQDDLTSLGSDNICKDEEFEQVVQQFAMVAYCPVNAK